MLTAYGFPATTEVTTAENTTISTTINNGYNFITSEVPVPSSKLRGILKAWKDLAAFVKQDNEALITPTLLNSWIVFGAGYYDPKYFKDKSNIVHVFGMLKSGTSANGTTLFTLPAGYRPAFELPIAVTGYKGAGADDVFIGLRLDASGNLKIGTAGAEWICFNFTFRVV